MPARRWRTVTMVSKLWQRVVDEQGLELEPEFLNNEWEQVILAHDCRSRADYFSVSRAGRGIPLDRRARAKVWHAVEEFTQRLADNNSRTHLQLASAAAGYVAGRVVKPYRHVVVDEAQDLHERQWRLIRALVDEQPDDLFIVGDSHQRIYDRRSSLSKVGINIRGRSRKLKVNYRTTAEILEWSLRRPRRGRLRRPRRRQRVTGLRRLPQLPARRGAGALGPPIEEGADRRPRREDQRVGGRRCRRGGDRHCGPDQVVVRRDRTGARRRRPAGVHPPGGSAHEQPACASGPCTV